MTRMAAVFPNEGSHYVGMGKEFYAKSLTVRKYYDEAEKILKSKIAKVCFLGPKEEQNLTVNAQVGTFLNDSAFLELLIQYKRKPELLTGVGVGEVAALVGAECLPFSVALKYVAKRGELIEAFAQKYKGLGLFLSGITEEQLNPMLNREEGELFITHFLSAESFIVWGNHEAVDSIKTELQGIRQIKMNPQLIRGPLFTEKALELESAFENLLTECLGENRLKSPKIPCICSEDGSYVGTVERAREILIRQYSKPIQWVKTVKAVIDRGFRTWVEVGPGKIYSSFVKKIDLDTRVMNVEDPATLAVVLKVTG
jgi:[acyl-carrier-protein] S-malonyltransferase